MAHNTNLLINSFREWNEKLCQESCALLAKEISPNGQLGRNDFRKALVIGYFFKFFIQVQSWIQVFSYFHKFIKEYLAACYGSHRSSRLCPRIESTHRFQVGISTDPHFISTETDFDADAQDRSSHHSIQLCLLTN